MKKDFLDFEAIRIIISMLLMIIDVKLLFARIEEIFRW